jgi:hypothetical protein
VRLRVRTNIKYRKEREGRRHFLPRDEQPTTTAAVEEQSETFANKTYPSDYRRLGEALVAQYLFAYVSWTLRDKATLLQKLE